MKRYLLIISALMMAAACDVALPERIDFGLSEKNVEVFADGGEYSVRVYSDGEVTLTPDKTPEWGVIQTALSFTGDNDVNIIFSENSGLRRSVNIVANYKNGLKLDTIHFKQIGVEAYFTAKDHALFIDSRSPQTTELGISTNVDSSQISSSINYIGDEIGWINSIKITSSKVIINTDSSQSEQVKKAIVTLSHTDGWGKILEETISVTLSNSSGKFGESVSFKDLRAMATGESTQIIKDLILKGVVISDYRSRNMDMNYNVAYNVVDTTNSLKSAYVQSEDGKLGFKLLFDDVDDNLLQQKQVVEILLVGKTIQKESDPEQYAISGLGVEDFKISETLDSIPSKVKRISELTDDDLNTFVEIPQTEFLNKDGAYTNVYDIYTLPASHNKASVSKAFNSDCWPAMIVDEEGRTIYAMINMMCPWRRTGNGVPKGVGSLKGILVHNEQPRYGDMGKYQIRVVDASGFAQSTTKASSFTELMVWAGKYKYNFTSYGTAFPYVETSGGMDTVIPSDDFIKSTGKHTGELYFENKSGQAMSGTKALRPCTTYDALKTSGSPGGGQVSNKGLSIQCNIGGFYNWKDDGTIESYNGIVARFSSEALTGKKLYLYYSFCCGGNDNHAFKNFPSRWAVDYSIDNGRTWTLVNAEETGEPYVLLRSFGYAGPLTVDGRAYYPSYSVGMGYTEHFYEFPSNILGQATALVRIRPYDTTVTSIPTDLADSIERASAYNDMDIYQDLRFNRIVFLTK